MNDLSNTISRYYFGHFEELPLDKKFHFASRLYLYSGNQQALELTKLLRPEISQNEQPVEALQAILQSIQDSPFHGSKNANELRKPYFEKYPMLRAYVMVLFRITFLKTVYGIDCRNLLFELFKQEELERMKTSLLADHEALAILSTHAINFLYLYERVINENDESLPLDTFLEVGKSGYDHADKLHLQLLVYLYTHCIIGDSQFYYRSIPKQHTETYLAMLGSLEKLITDNFDDINLDNKFEFLVCGNMVGFESRLRERIFQEAERSVSEDGSFLVDRHNNNPQANNISLDTSEHRNVLFIMANQPFAPQSS